MKGNISIETRKSESGEYLLVSISGNSGIIGVCDTSTKSGTVRKTFYIGGESLLNISYHEGDDSANRQIWQTSSIEKCKGYLGNKLQVACDGFFKSSVPLSKSIMPILEMMTDGLYVVHVSTVYPTDGAGNLFWSAYSVKHELTGSAPYIPVVEDKSYAPPYIVPTKAISNYSDKNVDAILSKVQTGRKVGGIAYHLTGMFSALLYGHTNACACLQSGEEFRCIVIEPLNRVMYSSDDSIEGSKIVALSCPFAKLRFDGLTRKMTENFLLNRSGAIPKHIEEIRSKADKMMSNGVFTKKISPQLMSKVDSCPDAEMLFSAFAIDELTDEDIEVLLNNGGVDAEGRHLISGNYYESIVYACNYLQLKDPRRFIEFAKAIFANEELSGTYSYVAGRIKYIMDSRINQMFQEIADSEDSRFNGIKQIAVQYGEAYKVYSENQVRSFISNSGIADDDDDKPVVQAASAEDGKQLSSMALANLIKK